MVYDSTCKWNGKNIEKWKRTPPPTPTPKKCTHQKLNMGYGLYMTIQPFGHKMSPSGTNYYYASTFLTRRNTSKAKEDKEAKEEKKIQRFAQSSSFFIFSGAASSADYPENVTDHFGKVCTKPLYKSATE